MVIVPITVPPAKAAIKRGVPADGFAGISVISKHSGSHKKRLVGINPTDQAHCSFLIPHSAFLIWHFLRCQN